MRKKVANLLLFALLGAFGCTVNTKKNEPQIRIAYLHHSTGQNIWNGKRELLSKISSKFEKSSVVDFLNSHNNENRTNYLIENIAFPKNKPYGWKNFPFDYYNIWVAHAGDTPYNEEPTLEMLTKEYKVIVWKHCFPVCNIGPDSLSGNIASEQKTLANYQLQYLALREKMHQFPDTRFLIWTGAAQVSNQISPDEATRAKAFFTWVTNVWDLPDDNIFIWDFYSLQTKGGLYFLPEFAAGLSNSHPNDSFAEQAALLFVNRLTDIIENKGLNTTLTGEKK